jgi:hypothetical protein
MNPIRIVSQLLTTTMRRIRNFVGRGNTRAWPEPWTASSVAQYLG